MKIGPYEFALHYNTFSIPDLGGIYSVLDLRDKSTKVLDIGESGELRTRLEGHPRRDCWLRHCVGTLAYAILHTPGLGVDGRCSIESQLRAMYRPDCGQM